MPFPRATCQSALRGDKHGYVGMDGTTVSNKDLVFYVFEGRPSRRSCWMAPKVAQLFTLFGLCPKWVKLVRALTIPPHSGPLRFPHTYVSPTLRFHFLRGIKQTAPWSVDPPEKNQ